MTKLIDFAKNIYSQNGEDGIIEEILKRTGLDLFGTACEFGAWDGMHLSNTFNLVKNKQWDAIYIEGDPEKYKYLLRTAEIYKLITSVNLYVSEQGPTSLDNILKDRWMKEILPIGFLDILSIDIDGYDYQIWQHVKLFNAAIVIIEINSSIPIGIEQIHDPKTGKQGTSFTSMLSLGIKKGYSLLCHTGNMIFLRNDFLLDQFNDIEINSNNLFLPKWVKQ